MVRQENSYYGFGLSLANSPLPPLTDNNKNLYNGGSEWQNDYGNLPDLQQTFYRNYDAALGRWIAVDPVAESAEDMSVYQYAGNNPIMMNDPLGDLLPDPGSKDAPIPWHTDTSWRGRGGPDPVGDWAADMSKAAEVANEIDSSGGATTGGGPGDTFSNVYFKIREAREWNGYTTMGGFTYDGSVSIRWQTAWAYYDKDGLNGVVVSHTKKFNVNSYSYGGDNGSAGDHDSGGAGQGGDTPYYDGLNKVNAIAGSSTILGLTGASVGYLKAGSVSLKWYSSGWRGGSRALIKTAQLSKLAETAGRVSVGIGFLADTYEFANGNISGSHYATNTVMGGLALTPIGFVTIPYFVIDAYYPGGFTAAMHDSAPLYNQMNQPNAAPSQVLMGMP